MTDDFNQRARKTNRFDQIVFDHTNGDLAPAAMPARYLAFFLDFALLIVAFYFLVTVIVYPNFHPDFMASLRDFLVYQQSLPSDISFKEMMEIQLNFQLEHERAIADTQFLYMVTVWIYFAISELTMKGSTLGKKAFRLQTLDLKTLEPAYGKSCLLRNCLKTISLTIFFPILLIIDLIIPIFSRFRLTGHDVLSKTIVTYEKPTIINSDTSES